MIHGEAQDGTDAKVVRVLERIEEHLAALRNVAAQAAREWLTVRDVAEQLQVSHDTIERLIASGKIRASEVATNEGLGLRHRYRIRRDWLDAFLLATANCQPPSSGRRMNNAAETIDFIGD